jgi:hypothetical protein
MTTQSKFFKLSVRITITYNIKRILYSQKCEKVCNANFPGRNGRVLHACSPSDDKSHFTIDFSLNNLTREFKISELLVLLSSFALRATPAIGPSWPGTGRAAAWSRESACTAASSTVCRFR